MRQGYGAVQIEGSPKSIGGNGKRPAVLIDEAGRAFPVLLPFTSFFRAARFSKGWNSA